MDDSDDFDSWRGNQHRKLWKSTCTRAALNPHLSTAERALYAALAPSPQTASHLKAACRTWSDHLWAQISVVCEEKESAEMSRLKASFWENPAEVDLHDSSVHMEASDDAEEEEWEREVVSSLESLASVSVEEG